MTELQHIQDQFQQYLLTENPAFENAIIGTDNFPITTRLGIYRNAYQIRLIDSLAINYPCLKMYLGCERFQEMALAYLQSHPSTYRSIRWFGDELAQYLSSNTAPDYPCLAELAEFEWKLTLAFDAADTHIFTINEMGNISPDAWATMRLIPHPSLQRLNFFWNVVSIWQSLVNNEEPDAPQKASSPISWVMWRANYINRYYSLSEQEAWAIDGMRNGITFGELCEGLCEFVPVEDVGMRAATLLKSWIQAGMLTKVC